MNARTIQFLSVILTIQFVESMIPFEIGSPLSIFAAMIFYYFIGAISIKFYYVMFTLSAIRSFPVVYEMARSLCNATLAIEPTPDNYVTPELVTAGLYIAAYAQTILWFIGTRYFIKKHKIAQRLGALS